MKHLFQSQFGSSRPDGCCEGVKYPSQAGTVPESAWQQSISGVRLAYEPVKIDLTPIDTSLCSSFAQAIGSQRFTEAGDGTFFEREAKMLSEMKHELAGKYRSYANPLNASARTKENEAEYVSKLCVCVALVAHGGERAPLSLRYPRAHVHCTYQTPREGVVLTSHFSSPLLWFLRVFPSSSHARLSNCLLPQSPHMHRVHTSQPRPQGLDGSEPVASSVSRRRHDGKAGFSHA